MSKLGVHVRGRRDRLFAGRSGPTSRFRRLRRIATYRKLFLIARILSATGISFTPIHKTEVCINRVALLIRTFHVFLLVDGRTWK